MSRTKANNANYAEYMERILNALINNSVDFNIIDKEMITDISMITLNEKNEMLSWAKNIQKKYNFKTSQYIGRSTVKEKGDLILDEKITELKCVSQNNGTYYNTSVNYFDKFHILNPVIAYEKIGYRNFLQKLIASYGFKTTDYGTMSFVDQTTSSIIQKLPIYKQIKSIDNIIRAIYVDKLVKYFNTHPQEAQTFINDMMKKDTKGTAEQLLIYNYFNNSMNLIAVPDIITQNTKINTIKKSGKYSLRWGSSAKATIAWQNGTGLNNFTIRVFI